MSKQSNRPRLGRGLSALLSMNEEPETPGMTEVGAGVMAGSDESNQPPAAIPANTPWRVIPVGKITANPHQPRRTMNDESLNDLATSLKTNGLIQPIVVREDGDQYQLIAGERRFRAAKIAGLTEIPAIVRVADAYTQAQLALVENIHREDLNPIERAMAYSNLLNQLGLTQAELATRLGEQRSSVANYLRLLDLSGTVRELVRDSKVSLGHAKVLAGVSDHAEQLRLGLLVVSQDLSVRNLERLVSTPVEDAQATKPKESGSAHLKDLETNLSRELGLRVQVRGAAKKGRVVIHYNNLDQFDDLVKRLGVELENT